MSQWQIELLGAYHVREGFDCGEESLNAFLRTYAGQNARQDISRTYVALSEDSHVVAGYYTIASGSVAIEDFPPELAKRLPKYPVPTIHLGRLAVDRRFHRKGLGALLLIDALHRVCDLADRVGIHAVTVHALNSKARRFYERHGFLSLDEEALHLYLPMAAIRKL
jgi:GNAT superfamily N-acetyltransferase